MIHFWQDEVSKHWQEHPIQVSDLNATVKINTYSIDLHLSNGNPKPVEGQIHISGKENMVIYINNKKYFLVSDKSIGLDFSDYINIVCPLDSIAAAPIVIAADFLDTDLVIDPTQGLQEKIKEKITSGKDLSNAKKQNGDLLIAGNYNAKELDEIAKTINTLAATAGQLGHESANSKSGNQITANGTVALAVSGSVSGNLWTETGNTLGDLFYSIKKGFTEVTAFVINKVKEGVQFVIEIAGKVVNWIVDTAKGAFAFLERIWEKLSIL